MIDFTDSANVAHGYVRSNQGVITVFDAPGAGTGPGQGTFPFNSPQLINPNGAITGFYTDSADALHGFVRDDNGVITTFDVPGAGTGAGQGTQSFAISPNGEITGFYFDGTDAVHGFLRDKRGVITTFDLPGGGTGPGEGTYGGGFAPNGTILGVLIDSNNVNHGFLLDKHGAVTTFDAPDAGTGFNQGTLPWDINMNGATTGWYVDSADVNHGFVRDKHGAIVEFDVPGNFGPWGAIAPNVAVTGVYQGRRRMTLTYPAINRARRVLWVVTGSEKTQMLQRLLDGDESIPAGRICRERASVLADRAAAGEWGAERQ